MSDLARLREVAEAATPGPWWLATDGEPWSGDQAMTIDLDARAAAGEVVDEEWEAWHATGTGSLFCGDVHSAPDGVFVATFDPPTVLALLDVLASRDARLAAVEALADEKHEPPIDLIHERCPAGGVGPGRECTACSAAGRAYLIGVEHVQRDLRAALRSDPDEGP